MSRGYGGSRLALDFVFRSGERGAFLFPDRQTAGQGVHEPGFAPQVDFTFDNFVAQAFLYAEHVVEGADQDGNQHAGDRQGDQHFDQGEALETAGNGRTTGGLWVHAQPPNGLRCSRTFLKPMTAIFSTSQTLLSGGR